MTDLLLIEYLDAGEFEQFIRQGAKFVVACEPGGDLKGTWIVPIPNDHPTRQNTQTVQVPDLLRELSIASTPNIAARFMAEFILATQRARGPIRLTIRRSINPGFWFGLALPEWLPGRVPTVYPSTEVGLASTAAALAEV